MFKLLLLVILTWPLVSFGEGEPLGNPKAPQGGNFIVNLAAEPSTLNPLNGNDGYAGAVHGYIIEGLLNRNVDTYGWQPGLAESWQIHDNKKIFDFTLRKGLKWSDGKPITTEDVKFGYDAIFSDDYQLAHLRGYLTDIKEVKILSSRKIRFITKSKLYSNFDVIAGGIIQVYPKHIYSDPEKSKKLYRTAIGSGPYILQNWDKGNKIILKKNPLWWGNSIDMFKGEYNFDTITMRFVGERNIAIEMLKKGDIDYISLQPEEYAQKTIGKGWGKKYFKIKTQNKSPKGYSFIGWNLRHPILKDREVRFALAHLFNRTLMNKKFNSSMSYLSTGPVYPKSIYASKDVDPILFNPEKALAMLRAAGWKDVDDDLILEKEINGELRELELTILEPLPDFVKYLTVFKEDAKKAGVRINIKQIEWNAFVKLLDERKFDAVRMAWGGGGVHWNPKQIWHSSQIENKGSNFVGYKNKEVDKLIEETLYIFDQEKRAQKLSRVHEIIAADAPYVFLFTRKYELYAHTDKVKKPKETYEYTIGTSYWWAKK